MIRASIRTLRKSCSTESWRAASEALFGRGSGGDSDSKAIQVIAESSDIPVHSIPRAEFGDGMLLLDALVRVGLASSKADARRSLQGGGYYVNGEHINDRKRRRTVDDLPGRDWVLLRKGKKNSVKIGVQ